MPSSTDTDTQEEVVPKAWMKKAKDNAAQNQQPDVSINREIPESPPEKRQVKPRKPANQQQEAPFLERGYKGMRPTKDRIAKFDSLIATEKNKPAKKHGPELIDEALDLLFKKYSV